MKKYRILAAVLAVVLSISAVMPVYAGTKGKYLTSIFYSGGEFYSDEKLTKSLGGLDDLPGDLLLSILKGSTFKGFYIDGRDQEPALTDIAGTSWDKSGMVYLDKLIDQGVDSVDAVAAWNEVPGSDSSVVEIQIDGGSIYYSNGKFYKDKDLTRPITDIKNYTKS